MPDRRLIMNRTRVISRFRHEVHDENGHSLTRCRSSRDFVLARGFPARESPRFGGRSIRPPLSLVARPSLLLLPLPLLPPPLPPFLLLLSPLLLSPQLEQPVAVRASTRMICPARGAWNRWRPFESWAAESERYSMAGTNWCTACRRRLDPGS